MKVIGSLIVCVCMVMVVGCTNVEHDNVMPLDPAKDRNAVIMQKQPPTEVKSVTDNAESGRMAFLKLIEDEKYKDNMSYLEQTKTDITYDLGEPDEQGWYEGGEFLQYDTFTYFINPETDIAASVAVQDVSLEQADIDEQLGSPDESYENKLEGLWTHQYNYGDGEIIIEKPSESSDEVVSVWFNL